MKKPNLLIKIAVIATLSFTFIVTVYAGSASLTNRYFSKNTSYDVRFIPEKANFRSKIVVGTDKTATPIVTVRAQHQVALIWNQGVTRTVSITNTNATYMNAFSTNSPNSNTKITWKQTNDNASFIAKTLLGEGY
ncbi:MAG: hypothetical protein PHD03_03345 [Bacilli bacterium]|nr:hypothetical protein [Bacilli bacterium]MDD4407134.1 hypothetical protein [Bacilli bacterium]